MIRRDEARIGGHTKRRSQTTVLRPQYPDDPTKNHEICCYEGCRRDDCGRDPIRRRTHAHRKRTASISALVYHRRKICLVTQPNMIGRRGSEVKDVEETGRGQRRQNTHCIRYGFNDSGECELHNRPAHPMISAIPATTAVGKSHHRRNFVASPMWMTAHTIPRRTGSDWVRMVERERIEG